jgi:hypothetical protein
LFLFIRKRIYEQKKNIYIFFDKREEGKKMKCMAKLLSKLKVLLFICCLGARYKYVPENFSELVLQCTSVACNHASHALAKEALLRCNTGTWVEDCPTYYRFLQKKKKKKVFHITAIL